MGIRPKRPKNGGRARRPCKNPPVIHITVEINPPSALSHFNYAVPRVLLGKVFRWGPGATALTHRDKDVMVMACLRVWPAVIHKENISALIEKSFIFLRCPVNIYSGWMWRGPGLFDLLEARYD
ncbi:hypothetical protein MTP99_009046 [Tenebrio molitor]|jgi:hypothetical protein|nr:hypothetical protein MTP99_009046 [Tenebrio molitor]